MKGFLYFKLTNTTHGFERLRMMFVFWTYFSLESLNGGSKWKCLLFLLSCVLFCR